MKKKMYTVFSYNNYEIKIMVYTVEEGKPFLLFDRLIDKVNLNEITSDLQKDKISLKVKEVLEQTKQITGKSANELYLVFDPESYYYTRKSYTFDFPENHTIERRDMKKMYDHILNDEVAKNGYRVINFNMKKLVKDLEKEVKKPVGMTMDKLTITGEVIFADSETYYNLITLIQGSEFRVIETRIGGYILKEEIELQPAQGLMEIGTEKISFIVNQDDNIKQFNIKWGFRKIFESVYESLQEQYGADASEEAVVFLMRYFPLKKYKYDAELVEGIYINEIINRFTTILIDYFTYIFEELKRQNLNINEFKVQVHEFAEEEIISLLDEALKPTISKIQIAEKGVIEKGDNLKVKLSIVSFEQFNNLL